MAQGVEVTPGQVWVHGRTRVVDALLANPDWLKTCKDAKVEPCRRQARKYHQGRGKAWRWQAEQRRK